MLREQQMRLDRERAEKMWELTKEAIAEDLGITVEELEKRIEEAKRQPVPFYILTKATV